MGIQGVEEGFLLVCRFDASDALVRFLMLSPL